MATRRRGSAGPDRRARWRTARLSRARIGTRLLLLLLVPTSALLLLTGVETWRDLQQVRQLAQFQQLVELSNGTTEVADAIAREEAATVRARLQPSAQATTTRDRRRVASDDLLASLRQAPGPPEAGDVDGQLDAVRRQLFALRLRADFVAPQRTIEGYRQPLATLDALGRRLTGRPPTRDVTRTLIADLAIQTAVDAARNEQLDIWRLMRDPAADGPGAAGARRWAELEREGFNLYRSWARSESVADLGAVLFSPAGIAVRALRAQLEAGELPEGAGAADRWWEHSGARLGDLAAVRDQGRDDLSAQIASDLASAKTSVRWRVVISLLVLGAGLWLGLLIARSITGSLGELSRSARALSGGDLDVPIASEGGDEIAAVGEAFQAVRTTNQRLVAEIGAMNDAIASKHLDHRANATAFRGAWADVLTGLNGTMTEVARLQASERRELIRQEHFGLVGRHVVGGELTLDEACAACCRLLVEDAGAVRAEVYEQTGDGWQRDVIAGSDASPWPAGHEFAEASHRADAGNAVIRRLGSASRGPARLLAIEFPGPTPPDAADQLFVDGIARLLDEAVHHRMTEIERIRTQKTEAAGTLAAAFAHDFNNVLGAILTNARLGEMETKEPEAATTFRTIAEAVRRASEVVDRLLRFARTAPVRSGEFDLRALVDEACALVRPGLPPSIVLECGGSREAMPVPGDSARIHQVIVNLITNAAQALGTSAGRITIDVDEAHCELGGSGGAPARCARVRVHDTGPGIPPEVAARIFEPFFTTKPEGQGTGLGLASARTIARDHQGTLDVCSEEGQGTTATLCLPLEPSGALAAGRASGD